MRVADAISIACDVLDLDQIKVRSSRAVSELGRIDVLCNIAGIGHFAKDEDETPEGWNRVIGVNLNGTYFMSQAALPHLLASGGNIVNSASTAGTHAQPYSSAYSASKGGVISLTQTMAISQGSMGVRVNCVAPGGVDTADHRAVPHVRGVRPDPVRPHHAVQGHGQPENLAAAFAFLASMTPATSTASSFASTAA